MATESIRIPCSRASCSSAGTSCELSGKLRSNGCHCPNSQARIFRRNDGDAGAGGTENLWHCCFLRKSCAPYCAGGASAALRRLVEEARRSHAGRDGWRQAKERAYRFMSAIAGGFPGFEEASRALFAQDADAFARCIAGWPPDVQAHLAWLARDAFAPEATSASSPA